MTFTNEEIQAMNRTNGKTKPQGFTPKPKADRPTATQPEASADLIKARDEAIALGLDAEKVKARIAHLEGEGYTEQEIIGILPKWALRQTATVTASEAIPTARTSALALSSQSHEAMKALQSQGLGNAAAYVQRKTLERNAVVDKVSDAIAYLSDCDLLEADIMSAAAAKVAARSNAWGYQEPVVDFDNLFALSTNSQRMLNGA